MNTFTPSRSRLQQRGFTMIEMIGVLAIIAILAVIVVPKVFSTIAGSRVTSAVASINAMRTAVTEFGGRYGAIPITAPAFPAARIDDMLVTAGMLENRFTVKIGKQPGTTVVNGAAWSNNTGQWVPTGGTSQVEQSRIICSTSVTTVPSASSGANFYLLRNGTSLPAGSRVVAAVIEDITISEARDLSLRIDGDAYSTTPQAAASLDNMGKVVYAAAVGGTTDAYVYLAHQ